jgi:hypothetical protein
MGMMTRGTHSKFHSDALDVVRHLLSDSRTTRTTIFFLLSPGVLPMALVKTHDLCKMSWLPGAWRAGGWP